MLLGASGGGQFLLVLPAEFRAQAEEFCLASRGRCGADEVAARFALSGRSLKISATGAMYGAGLHDELQRRAGTPAAIAGAQAFDPAPAPRSSAISADSRRNCVTLPPSAGPPNNPRAFFAGSGKYSWPSGRGCNPVYPACRSERPGLRPGRLTDSRVARQRDAEPGVYCAAASTAVLRGWTRRSRSKSTSRCRTCSSAFSAARSLFCVRFRISGARSRCSMRERVLSRSMARGMR